MKYQIKHGDPKGKLDKAFATARDGEWIEIVDGVHETDGSWLFENQGYQMGTRGVTIEGKGTIQLSPDARKTFLDGNGERKVRVDRDLWFRFGWGVCLYGVTLDLNQKAFAGGPQPWYCLGVRFVEGGPCQVDNITIEGLRGVERGRDKSIANWVAGCEAFPLSMEGKPGSFKWSRVTVRDCADDSYVSAIFPGGSEIADAGTVILVEDCDVDLGKGNWAGYSANVITRDASVIPVRFKNCRARGVQRGFHNDTGPTMASLEGCAFDSEYCGVSLADGLPETVRSVVLTDCELRDDCGVILTGPANNEVIAVNTLFKGSRFGYVEGVNSRLRVVNPIIPDGNQTPRLQTLVNGENIRNLNDRRLVLA